MIEILCVRHGQAAAGWHENADPGLSDLGVQQAHQVAQALVPFNISRIVSSPMQRTRETAIPTGQKLNLEVQVDAVFREIPTPSTVPLEKRLDWLRTCSQSKWPDLEVDLQQWRERIIQTLTQIETPTVIFTHFMVLNAIVGYIQGETRLVNYQPDYCSVLKIAREDSKLVILDIGSQAQSRIL